jgi:3-(3-hydroxy-phenyl)propionate hydroxylase
MTENLYSSFPVHPFRRPPELDGAPLRWPVAIVGGGPVGLTLALGLAARGIRSVVLEPRDTVSFGSRAICLSRRSLEIADRVGVLQALRARSLPWTGGTSFWGTRPVLRFTMPHDAHQRLPPMVNIQQCFLEQILTEAVGARAQIDLRWCSTVIGLERHANVVKLVVNTPQGDYALEADWVIACDGAKSFTRQSLGLSLQGTSYEGRYLIADIKLASNHPTERRAWFDPPSDPGSTILMHRQPHDIWRIDYQLRDDADETAELQEERVRARIDAHLRLIGESAKYELIWTSVYRARALTLDRYRHGRVLFAGDAAHLVPIFGVRGLNSGLDDVDNLSWKLAAVIKGAGGDGLLDSYSFERLHAAKENIRHAAKSTLFMTPPSSGYRLMREAALSLALRHEFARPLINPRQSVAIPYADSPLSTPDVDLWEGGVAPGVALPDAAIGGAVNGMTGPSHLLDLITIGRDGPILLCFAGGAMTRCVLDIGVPVFVLSPGGSNEIWSHPHEPDDDVAQVLNGAPGATYLVRPDGYVAARWKNPTASVLRAACNRAISLGV